MAVGTGAGLAGLGGKGGKVNMGALQSHFQQNMKQAKTKERMLNKLHQKQQQQQQQPQPSQIRPTTSVFKVGEQIQQTPRPMTASTSVAQTSTRTSDAAGENNILPTETANAEVAQKKKKKKNKK
jgi:hypothetical protein